jgi:putrescine transport system permease protein
MQRIALVLIKLPTPGNKRLRVGRRGHHFAKQGVIFFCRAGRREFVIPELLGGPDSIMIGRVLWQEFFNNRDWPVASAVAIVMLLLLIVPIMWFHKHQQKQMGDHG